MNLSGQRSRGKKRGESSTPLCDRASAWTRERSPRQLPTDLDYVGGLNARSTDIRLINRRVSHLDRCPVEFIKTVWETTA